MKRIILIFTGFTWLSILLTGCDSCNEKSNKKFSDAHTLDSINLVNINKAVEDALAMYNISTDPCQGSIGSRDTHKINFEKQAAEYIAAFQRLFYKKDAVNGWTEIPIKYLTEHFTDVAARPTDGQTKHCGLVLYFCEEGGSYYVAYSSTLNVNERSDPFPIFSNSEFYKSDCSHGFDESIPDAETMIKELSSYKDLDCELPETSKPFGDYTEVNKFANNFLIHILGANAGKPGVLENPVGFFHNDQIRELIKQKDDRVIKGIRIYWAYEEKDANYIKLVAFAINKDDGSNLCYKNNVKKDGTAVILERSWPPN